MVRLNYEQFSGVKPNIAKLNKRNQMNLLFRKVIDKMFVIVLEIYATRILRI